MFMPGVKSYNWFNSILFSIFLCEFDFLVSYILISFPNLPFYGKFSTNFTIVFLISITAILLNCIKIYKTEFETEKIINNYNNMDLLKWNGKEKIIK